MTLALDHATERRLDPWERLELLCDEGSLRAIRSQVSSRRMGERARPGDGVVGAAGEIAGRPVCCYAQDPSFAGGSLGQAHADTILRVLRLAGRSGVPVVGFVESGGARMQEGMAALAGYGRIFRENVALSGKVPQISIITGTAAGGASYSPALTDFVVMTERANMFLTGPGVVREALGEELTGDELGGRRVHERNGVCQFVVASDVESVFLARELLGYLPQQAGEEPPRRAAEAPGSADPAASVPRGTRHVYDVRDVVRALADGGRLLEAAPRWARNVVTAFCRLGGRPVGVIANQPRHLGGTLDAESAQKAARFVRTCDTYGLPLVVLVDTPGFMPGSRQESAGVIRHGAKLLHAFAAATVPRISVVLRKAFGGAYITMNAKDLGADLALAWPDAELGIMAARQAVGIVNRRELAAAGDDAPALRDRLTDEYTEEHLAASVAAAEGFVDEVVEPADTRGWLLWGLETVRGRGGDARSDGNIQL
ncbi:MAG: methylmalonyl-CoA carboxyltransferase [Actinomycetota bacterium]|nr:methylmalonyl-CoA carboxyltransferase [Actinomycetota bacterium]